VLLEHCDVERAFLLGISEHHRAEDEDDSSPVPHVSTQALAAYVAALAPALVVDVDVRVADDDYRRAVSANDWIDPAPTTLLERIGDRTGGDGLLETIGDPQQPRARIAMTKAREPLLNTRHRDSGVIVAGGLRVASTHEAAGIIVVDVLDAARGQGRALLDPHEVTAWATSQARRLGDIDDLELTARVLELGGDQAEMAVARSADRPLSTAALERWASARTEIVVVDVASALSDERDHQWIPQSPRSRLAADVLDVPHRFGGRRRPLLVGVQSSSLTSAVVACVQRAWAPDRMVDSDELNMRNDVLTVDEVDYLEIPVSVWRRERTAPDDEAGGKKVAATRGRSALTGARFAFRSQRRQPAALAAAAVEVRSSKPRPERGLRRRPFPVEQGGSTRRCRGCAP